MWVRRGRKRWSAGGHADLLAGPGMLIAAPRGTVADVGNEVDGKGLYEAVALVFPAELIAEAEAGGGDVSEALRAACIVAAGPDLLASIARAHEVLVDARSSPRLRWLRAAEVLEWLRLAGVRFAGRPLTPCERVVRLLSSDPGHDWTLDSVAAALAMGPSTLRRHLAAGGEGFVSLRRAVRLERALGLLQAGDAPVTAIALAVGFASPSKFAAAFKSRFGFAPSRLREAPSAPEPRSSDSGSRIGSP